MPIFIVPLRFFGDADGLYDPVFARFIAQIVRLPLDATNRKKAERIYGCFVASSKLPPPSLFPLRGIKMGKL
jgi:hypothetical protein